MTSTPIKILCVDDSPQLTAALEKLFAAQADMQSVGVLHRADDLVKEASERQADVVLLDLTMDGQDPVGAIQELARQKPQMRVVVFSGLSDEDSIGRAIAAGAWGYVDKGELPTAILAAIRSVARGEVVLPRRRYSRGE